MSAATVSTHTIAGKTFRASARTAAHLEWTIGELKAKYPATRLRIIQPCYNTGVSASAGTHDFDAVFDFEIVGMPWKSAQAFLRASGWGCWWRNKGAWANESAWHIHAISLGYPGKVGIYVPGQVDDYYRHAFGLAGQHRTNSDTSWFPPNIDATVFDYPAHLVRQAAAAATYLDVTIALARLAGDSKNPDAKPIYLKARGIVGKLVSDGRRVSVPRTTAEVIRVLEAKRAASSNYWTKYRLGRVIKMLRPLT